MYDRARTVTTRELLRNFKSLKEELLSGKLHVVHIAIDHREQLQMTPVPSQKTLGDFLEEVQKLRKPLRVRRVHLFDELLRPRRLRA